MIPAAAKTQYRTQQALTAEAVAASQRLWRRMDASDLDMAWRSILPALMAVVTASQLRAAEVGAEYVPQIRQELNISSRQEGEMRPSSLAGVASNGAPLELTLAGGLYSTKRAIGKGASTYTALRAGGMRLGQTVQLQVADAGRVASSINTVGDKALTKYTRVLTHPSCSRCVLLAGQTYWFAEPFQRHPRCDCRHIPCNEDVAGDLTSDPQDYFQSLSEPEQDRIFTKAGAQAIRDGANMNQVVNARRGMYTTRGGNLATSAGSSRRGLWGSSQTEFDRRTGGRVRTARRDRMMPETIYSLTNDRDEQIRLLKYYRFMF